jgi:hypothetical protein
MAIPSVASEPIDVFISYAPGDKPLLDELLKHLDLLRRNNVIRAWHDRDITAGSERKAQIHKRLSAAKVILLLVSAEFVKSDDCWDVEMQRAMERHKSGEAVVIPVVLRHVDGWQDAAFGRLVALPSGGKPVADWDDRDKAFADVARGIRGAIASLKAGAPISQAALWDSGAGRRPMPASDRDTMLEQVRRIWISESLESEVFGGVRIPLRLTDQPNAVTRKIDELRPGSGLSAKPIPDGSKILDLFEKRNKAILIMGAEGSGKTMLLLELLEGLLERAEQEPDQHPRIPVVFGLWKWSDSQPLEDWLIDQLREFYDVNKPALAREWVKEDQIIPLLDGLDLIDTSAKQLACIEAINEYRRSHGFTPIVVCSRTEEYKAISEKKKLSLYGALGVEYMTREDVSRHLCTLGPAGTRVQDALDADRTLWDLLESPLMLWVLLKTCADDSSPPHLGSGTLEQRRDRLFSVYVKRAFIQRKDKPLFDLDETIRWLSYLARQMDRRGERVFRIDRLQTDWLTSMGPKLYVIIARILFGILMGLAIGALYVVLFGVAQGIRSGAVAAIGGLLIGPYLHTVRFLNPTMNTSDEIVCAEAVTWSPEKARNAVRGNRLGRVGFALSVGLPLGVIQAALVALAERGAYYASLWGVASAAIYFVIGWLFHGLLGFVSGGVVQKEIDTGTSPNEGIVRSLRNGVVYGSFFGIGACFAVMIVLSPIFWSIGDKSFVAQAALAVSVGAGVVGCLLHGGSAVVKHVVVRCLLALERSAPLRYAKFLNFACDRILLRRRGNGFRFQHDLFLKHFASQSAPSGNDPGENAKE